MTNGRCSCQIIVKWNSKNYYLTDLSCLIKSVMGTINWMIELLFEVDLYLLSVTQLRTKSGFIISGAVMNMTIALT